MKRKERKQLSQNVSNVEYGINEASAPVTELVN